MVGELDVSALRQFEAGRLAITPVPGDANAPVREVVEAFRPLAEAKKIKLEHGGRIWVESTLGADSTFYFTLRKSRS